MTILGYIQLSIEVIALITSIIFFCDKIFGLGKLAFGGFYFIHVYGSDAKLYKAEHLAYVVVYFLADVVQCFFLDLQLGLEELGLVVFVDVFFFQLKVSAGFVEKFD